MRLRDAFRVTITHKFVGELAGNACFRQWAFGPHASLGLSLLLSLLVCPPWSLQLLFHGVMQAINFEKKQLLQQWKTSLIGMQRRDEALRATEDALEYVVPTNPHAGVPIGAVLA